MTDDLEDQTPRQTWTIPEFAALCRERCSTPAQWYEGVEAPPCGTEYKPDEFAFCGRHWGPVLGGFDA